MSSPSLRVLSGWSLVLGGILCVIGGLFHPVVHGHAHSAEAVRSGTEAYSFAGLLSGTVLLILGLPAVYGWLAPRLGVLGLVGVVLYLVGNMLSAIPHVVVNALVAPQVARTAPELISPDDLIISGPFAVEQVVTGLVLVGGLLVLGIALLRSGAVPRWIGAVAILGAVLNLVPAPVLPVVSGLQVELCRAVVVIAFGLLAIRSTTGSTTTREVEPALH